MPRGMQRSQEPSKALEKIGEFLRGDGIPEPNVAAYLKRLERDWAGILPWLPSASKCHAFLDIGCGLGGHAALLAARYPRATSNLLDGKENRPKQPEDAGFREKGEPWVNVYRAARMLSHCCNSNSSTWTYPEVLDPDGMVGVTRGDLMVSFRALGHHFSVMPYLPLLVHSLASGGRVILDIRNGTDGLARLTDAGFRFVGEIEQQSTKCRRFVLEKA